MYVNKTSGNCVNLLKWAFCLLESTSLTCWWLQFRSMQAAQHHITLCLRTASRQRRISCLTTSALRLDVLHTFPWTSHVHACLDPWWSLFPTQTHFSSSSTSTLVSSLVLYNIWVQCVTYNKYQSILQPNMRPSVQPKLGPATGQ